MGPSSNQSYAFLLPNVTVVDRGKGTTSTSCWANNLGFPIYIYRGYVWCGVSGGNEGDVAIWLTSSTGGLYIVTNDDHYEDRGGLPMNQIDFDLSPGWDCVPPGGTITLSLTAVADARTPSIVSEAFALIRYME